MTTKLERIARLIESVEYCAGIWSNSSLSEEAEDARAALAELQAEEDARAGQEPVAWQWRRFSDYLQRWMSWSQCPKEDFDEIRKEGPADGCVAETRALYAHPVAAGATFQSRVAQVVSDADLRWLITQARGGLALAAGRIGPEYVADDKVRLANIEAALSGGGVKCSN